MDTYLATHTAEFEKVQSPILRPAVCSPRSWRTLPVMVIYHDLGHRILNDSDMAGPGRVVRALEEDQVATLLIARRHRVARQPESFCIRVAHAMRWVDVDADPLKHVGHEAGAVDPAILFAPASPHVRRVPVPLILQPREQRFRPICFGAQAFGKSGRSQT